VPRRQRPQTMSIHGSSLAVSRIALRHICDRRLDVGR
jgi:hypothetical protein